MAIRVPERLKSANAYASSVPPGNKAKESVSHHSVHDQENIPIYQPYPLLCFINGTYNFEIRILKIQINQNKKKRKIITCFQSMYMCMGCVCQYELKVRIFNRDVQVI